MGSDSVLAQRDDNDVVSLIALAYARQTATLARQTVNRGCPPGGPVRVGKCQQGAAG